MFEELIKEIEKYQEHYVGDDCCEVINEVITMIEKYEPPILDKPDSEGWWWHKNRYGKLDAVVIGGGNVHTHKTEKKWTIDGYVRQYGGTWQKAIVNI